APHLVGLLRARRERDVTAAAELATALMKSRRLIAAPRLKTAHRNGKNQCAEGAINVRFGSLADICGATADVRFTLNSDRESGFPQKAMSALPPKADMCGATGDVRFVPIADIGRLP